MERDVEYGWSGTKYVSWNVRLRGDQRMKSYILGPRWKNSLLSMAWLKTVQIISAEVDTKITWNNQCTKHHSTQNYQQQYSQEYHCSSGLVQHTAQYTQNIDPTSICMFTRSQYPSWTNMGSLALIGGREWLRVYTNDSSPELIFYQWERCVLALMLNRISPEHRQGINSVYIDTWTL